MKPVKQKIAEKYKECAGKQCQNEGKIELIVKYVDKRGHFCESCIETLIRLGLARHKDNVTGS
jgi:hypothetical protein